MELDEWLNFNAKAYKGKEVQGQKELQMMHDRLEESIGRRTQQKSHHHAAAAAAASAAAIPASATAKDFKSLVLAIFKAVDSSGNGWEGTLCDGCVSQETGSTYSNGASASWYAS